MDALKYHPNFHHQDYSKGQFIKDLIAGSYRGYHCLPLSVPLPLPLSIPNKVFTQQWLQAFYFLLGSSRVQIGGPTAAFVVIIYGIIAPYGMAGLTVATLMAGLCLLSWRLLRFGDLISSFPKPSLGYLRDCRWDCGWTIRVLSLEMKSVASWGFLERWLPMSIFQVLVGRP